MDGTSTGTLTLSGATSTYSGGLPVGCEITLNTNSGSALGTGTLSLSDDATLGSTSAGTTEVVASPCQRFLEPG